MPGRFDKATTGERKDGDSGALRSLEPVAALGCGRARVWKRSATPTTAARSASSPCTPTGMPDDFPASVLAESGDARTARPIDGRVDLRNVPLLTIDPVDARDHDDAVYAGAGYRSEKPAAGIVVIVAIADVAHYIRSGTRLDKEAQIRGNSVYFPDRVVPMLPERISNDLCSLRELEERPASPCAWCSTSTARSAATPSCAP